MKIIYSKPSLQLTAEEEVILSRASTLLDSICSKTENYDLCKDKCPIYEYCPYHNDYTTNENGRLSELLESIVFESKREEP